MPVSQNIADIRKDYQLSTLDEHTAGNDPLAFFGKWFAEAEAAGVEEVNAMTLATVDVHNKPHARIVLLKALEQKGFVFYTNYSSSKGREIDANTNVAAVFFWKELERQVRIEGTVQKVPPEESDHYFHSRPKGSQLGAWASPQSQVIPTRDILDNNYKQYENQFGDSIPRPPHWGGYCIIPHYIEFWQGRSNRMHDRIAFLQDSEGWKVQRLAP